MNARLKEFLVDNNITDEVKSEQWRNGVEKRYGLMSIPKDLDVPYDAWKVKDTLRKSVMALMSIDQLLGEIVYDGSITDCLEWIKLWKEDHDGLYGLAHDQGWCLSELRTWVCESIHDYRFVLENYIESAKEQSNKKQYLGWKTVAA